MSDRVKGWDQYFSIHRELPAAAIRDLLDEIERLRAALERLAYDSHGYADDKSGVWHMAKIAREALKDD